MYKNLYLKKGKEESLERFHPWIFSGAIHHIEGEPEEGDVDGRLYEIDGFCRKIERLVQDKQFLGNRPADSILESRGCRE